MRRTQVSSGRTTTQALISATLSAPFAAAEPIPASMPNCSCIPSARPPPAAADPTMNLRRERLVTLARVLRTIFVMMDLLALGFGLEIGVQPRPPGIRRPRGHVHRDSNALIRSA